MSGPFIRLKPNGSARFRVSSLQEALTILLRYFPEPYYWPSEVSRMAEDAARQARLGMTYPIFISYGAQTNYLKRITEGL